MSDEDEESMSEGFSASEDEWKPGNRKSGESSDDDDSDFEEVAGASGGRASAGGSKKRDQKQPSGIKGVSVKKRKPTGQSLRSKLYNKYRPPPKTFPTSPTNSPSASSSNAKRTASKNAKTPNESGEQQEDNNDDDSSSDSSIDDYLVNPDELDLQSSYFKPITGNADEQAQKEKSPAPVFDCNAGITNLSDSGSEDNNDSSIEDIINESKAFDFRKLLENANSLERAKETLAKRAAETESQTSALAATTFDVKALLTLGENQNYANPDEQQEQPNKEVPSKLSKTKSTRVKRHTKTRPASTFVAGADSDDSDWEEVSADNDDAKATTSKDSANGNLEIHVDLPTRHQRTKQQKTQDDLELALKRKLNRDLKDRQLLVHKTSLLCLIARSYKYNHIINNTTLMQTTLKLLPNKNAYPTERGTEIKYFQSFVTWFKTVIKLLSPNLYAAKCAKRKSGVIEELHAQIKRKEARCKQDMILIFIILARAMGMHARFVVNMQPLPLRPPASALIAIKLSNKDGGTSANVVAQKRSQNETKETKSKGKLLKIKTTTESTIRSPATTQHETSTDAKPTLFKLKRTATIKTNKEAVDEIKKQKVAPQINVLESSPVAGRTRKVAAAQAKQIQKDQELFDKVAASVPPTKLYAKSLPLPIGNEHSKAASAAPGTRSRSKSPKFQISPKFLASERHKEKFPKIADKTAPTRNAKLKRPAPADKIKIAPEFLKATAEPPDAATTKSARVLRTRQQKATSTKDNNDNSKRKPNIPQLDGADDEATKGATDPTKRPKLVKLRKPSGKEVEENSDQDFEPSSWKRVKKAPKLLKVVQALRKDRRVLSTDDEVDDAKAKLKTTASDMWIELWSDLEEEWICVDLFKGKLHCVDTIRKAASASLAYVFALQNDLTLKDVTARYCPHWTTTVRKARVEKSWLDAAIAPFLAIRTRRDIKEDQALRRIHEDKPMPTSISDYKDHPLYALERHLLKFQAIYPPDAPTLGFVRGEPVYSRDCVHLLHSREIWLKQARVVKLKEQPYKIVKARPKWDRLTQTVIKDQPLEIFGYWQTQDYDPPSAENGVVPRNAYGNVELFKACMLPKKTVHLRLPGLNRICKKLGIDCANAVNGFDFHSGACHPTYDGFVICEEFLDQVTAAWYQDQEDQDRKEQEKYEARVYGNWKKLIKGLIIRERLKKKYNF